MSKSKFAIILPSALVVTLASCFSNTEHESPSSGVHQFGNFECDELDSNTLNRYFDIDEEWKIIFEDVSEDFWVESSEEESDESNEGQSNQTCWYRVDSIHSEPELYIFITYYPDEERAEKSFEHFLELSDTAGVNVIEEVIDHGLEWDRVGVEEENEDGFHAQFLDSNMRVRTTMGEQYPEGATNDTRLEILSALSRIVSDKTQG